VKGELFNQMKNIKNKPTVELHDGEFMTIDGVLHSIIARHNFTAPLYHQRGGATFYVFKVIIRESFGRFILLTSAKHSPLIIIKLF